MVDISQIVKALETNTTLTGISFLGNRIGNNGAALIAGLLLLNSTLKSINLKSNGITDASPIAEALAVNSSLTHLDFTFNGLNPSSVAKFTLSLQSNYTLKFLTLRRINFVQEERRAIKALLKSNRKASKKSQIIHTFPSSYHLFSKGYKDWIAYYYTIFTQFGVPKDVYLILIKKIFTLFIKLQVTKRRTSIQNVLHPNQFE